MEIQGEELKKHLIDFRKDLMGINEDIDRAIKKIPDSYTINKEQATQDFEMAKKQNLKLIKIVQNQLKRDF